MKCYTGLVGQRDYAVGPDESAFGQRWQEGGIKRATHAVAVGRRGDVHAGFDGPLVGDAFAVGGSVGVAKQLPVGGLRHPKRETPGDARQAFRKVVQRRNFSLEGRRRLRHHGPVNRQNGFDV